MLLDDETTIVVPPAFDARILNGGDLLMSRRVPAVDDAASPAARAARPSPGAAPLDAIGLQIVWSRLIATVEEQARVLMRTAFSPTVREAGDLSAGVFDARGRLVAQAVTGTPGHVNSMAEAVRHFLVRFPLDTLGDGDHFITNDPWLSSGHLHDVTVVSPVFANGRPIAFFACTCHQVDIGGLGQGPDGRSVYEEGLFIPIMRLMRAGSVNQDLLDIVRANVRQPDQVVGDLMSYVTANSVSGRRLVATLHEYGIADFQALAELVIERSRVATREAIRALPDGVHRYAMQIDGYDRPVDLCATLTIDGERLSVDFGGSSPASPRGINLVLNYTRAYSAFGLRAAIAPHVPNNAGSLAPFEIDAPPGSILNVQHPWPVSARHIIGQFLPDVVFGCLAGVLPDRVPAEGASCVWGAQLRGGPQVSAAVGMPELTTESFETLFFNSGGSGARPGADGLSATAFPSGIKAISCEVIEAGNPIVIWKKELLPASGGAGRWRGGAGQRIEIGTINGAPFQFFGMYDRVQRPARGRAGGGDGAPGWVGLTDGTALAAMGLQTVPAHARLRLDVPGGGGHGVPPDTADHDR
ncbi:hydantoinase B/oxoprolinase family protein [Chitinasiproducens palmae]|uniref:5-oxoprolinase (ATP-hydrolysing)/N-methylhydantoinase B n=1 Tax=Chitinasiproducens palmae TaxID=1770053 RepID=A0A1H2PV85_9BURK|nr:hydantoinase B/oxoprolinase family protein [Chitinasiproducens palmae]SDV51186.1 5-oxoprolinase (ATP-hydrolysing)/N-methylhydantoinase B [Chitinasiproducens palmae]